MNCGHTYEVNISAWIDLRDFLFKNEGSVYGTASCRDAGDEDLCAVCFKDFLDATPVSHLERSYGGTYGDRIEAKKTMTEDNRVLG